MCTRVGCPLSHVLQEVYSRLLACYGPQQWWPADDPFEMMVGAILTQAAAWVNVERAIDRLKGANTLLPAAIRQMPHQELSGLIYPSGYYRAKATKLKAFANWLGERYHDDLDRLFALDIESLRRELLSIYGIGEETADSIILYGARKPIFVIDAYTRRITSRLGLTSSDVGYAALQRLFMENLTRDQRLFNEYHALLVRHGKSVCLKVPLCRGCCLGKICPSGSENP